MAAADDLVDADVWDELLWEMGDGRCCATGDDAGDVLAEEVSE